MKQIGPEAPNARGTRFWSTISAKQQPEKKAMCAKYGFPSREYNLAFDTARAMVGSAQECLDAHAELLEGKLNQAMLGYLLAKAGKESKFCLNGRRGRIDSLEARLAAIPEQPAVFGFGKKVYYQRNRRLGKNAG